MNHRNGNDELDVMNADGTSQARVTNCAALLAACRYPRWSPDTGDQRILYNFSGTTSSLRTIMAKRAPSARRPSPLASGSQQGGWHMMLGFEPALIG
jgi:hypothetical protein